MKDAVIRAVDLAGIIAVLSFSVSFLGNLVSALMGLILGLPDISFVGRILAAPREDSIAGGADQRIRGRIEFSHVSFAYHPGQTPILRDVSFTVEPGEYVAITGPSGSGKSTLIRLMLGFETATGGDVLFDDLEIGQHDLQSLRRQMGVVLQQEGLISGSVKMHIAMDENADMDLVTAAAKKAQIHDVIQSWPMGYNSFLSSESALISGGEKQRILLARALMHEPRILILDEATSAMDNITQDLVKRGLDEMGITRIVVAHRLSTIRDCDKIIVLEKGTIREIGKYDELMAANGLFAEMARRNLL